MLLQLRWYRLLGLTMAVWITAAFAVVHGQDSDQDPVSDSESNRRGPSYVIDLSQSVTRYVTIEVTAESTGNETVLMMPTWTPGSYLIREYAKHIDQISATDTRGNSLRMEKTSKNRWVVDTEGVETFQLSYRLFCDEVSVRTNSVDFKRAVLVGAGTFLAIPEQVEHQHRVRLVLPKHWSASSSSLRKGRNEHAYVASSYDELVDSPIVAGNVVEYPFEVAGVPHYLVNVGQTGDFNYQSAIEDVSKLVAEHHKLWGEIPYDRYYFITVLGGGGGGLEHDNSCLMMVQNLDVRDRGNYARWLSLVSHEFFHTWNVRRLRPVELVDYDYENETYTPSLWIMEGLTSFYEELLLVRSGVWTREEFLGSLSGLVQRYQRTEGRLVQSLKDSSHDAWIKFYRPESNSRTTQVSYYVKGAVVAMLLDARIRVATQGEKSLDDVMREFWIRHQGKVGYTETDFRQLCSEVAGEDLSSWFSTSVDSIEELDYQEFADWFGFDVGDVKARRSSESSSEEGQAEASDSRPQRQTGNARRWIGIGEFDSPATAAGLADTDEILAINGTRAKENVEQLAQQFEVGEPVKILIARDGVLQEILLVIGARPPQGNWSVRTATRTSRPQRQNLRDWLGN